MSAGCLLRVAATNTTTSRMWTATIWYPIHWKLMPTVAAQTWKVYKLKHTNWSFVEVVVVVLNRIVIKFALLFVWISTYCSHSMELSAWLHCYWNYCCHLNANLAVVTNAGQHNGWMSFGVVESGRRVLLLPLFLPSVSLYLNCSPNVCDTNDATSCVCGTNEEICEKWN